MGDKLGKHSVEPRMSFSHARTKPLVVESVKRRIATPTTLLCPSCGAKMRCSQEDRRNLRHRVRTARNRPDRPHQIARMSRSQTRLKIELTCTAVQTPRFD